jgi:hypothetical protein
MLPFSGLSPHEFVKIFPKKGDTYKGHSYDGSWHLNDVCDANYKLYDEYADDYGRWHTIKKDPPRSTFSWLEMVEREVAAL